jgi:hypothetical protein
VLAESSRILSGLANMLSLIPVSFALADSFFQCSFARKLGMLEAEVFLKDLFFRTSFVQ